MGKSKLKNDSKEKYVNGIGDELNKIISKYGFEKISSGEFHTNVLKTSILNDSNCQFDVFITILRPMPGQKDLDTIRVSVSNLDSYYVNAVDLFETTRMDVLDGFIKTLKD